MNSFFPILNKICDHTLYNVNGCQFLISCFLEKKKKIFLTFNLYLFESK